MLTALLVDDDGVFVGSIDRDRLPAEAAAGERALDHADRTVAEGLSRRPDPARRSGVASLYYEKEVQMELSARNQLKGKVARITTGTVMAEVTVEVAGNEVVAAITRGSVERLGLAEGDEVTVVIKATEVMLAK